RHQPLRRGEQLRGDEPQRAHPGRRRSAPQQFAAVSDVLFQHRAPGRVPAAHVVKASVPRLREREKRGDLMNKESTMVGRRQFIATSALAVAATALGPKLFAGEGLSIAQRVAVGYAPFDDGASVTSAAAIPAGDGGFIGRGARISLSGVSGAPEDSKA